MLTWMLNNWGNLLLLSVLVPVLILAIRSVRRNHKQGGCPSGCGGCCHSDHCRSHKIPHV